MKEIQQDEFIQFMKENMTSMYRFAYSIVKNETDAEDVVSEAIVKGYENLYKLRQKEKLKAWIMTIISNEAKKVYKKRKNYVSEEFLPEVLEKRKNYEIWDIVTSLPSDFSKVVVLYYYEGFSTKEIAKLLKIPEGTVKSRLSRAREKLRIELDL